MTVVPVWTWRKVTRSSRRKHRRRDLLGLKTPTLRKDFNCSSSVFQGSELVYEGGQCCPQCPTPRPSCIFEGKAHEVLTNPSERVHQPVRRSGEQQRGSDSRLNRPASRQPADQRGDERQHLRAGGGRGGTSAAGRSSRSTRCLRLIILAWLPLFIAQAWKPRKQEAFNFLHPQSGGNSPEALQRGQRGLRAALPSSG